LQNDGSIIDEPHTTVDKILPWWRRIIAVKSGSASIGPREQHWGWG